MQTILTLTGTLVVAWKQLHISRLFPSAQPVDDDMVSLRQAKVSLDGFNTAETVILSNGATMLVCVFIGFPDSLGVAVVCLVVREPLLLPNLSSFFDPFQHFFGPFPAFPSVT